MLPAFSATGSASYRKPRTGKKIKPSKGGYIKNSCRVRGKGTERKLGQAEAMGQEQCHLHEPKRPADEYTQSRLIADFCSQFRLSELACSGCHVGGVGMLPKHASEAIKTGERGVLLERLKSSVTCDSEHPELSNLRSFKKSDRTALKKSSGAEVKTSWWWPVQTAKSEVRGNFGWQRWKSGKVAGSGRRMLPLHIGLAT